MPGEARNVKQHTIKHDSGEENFEGKKLDEKILGTDPDDTKQIAYYETLDGRYLKHVIHHINKDESEQRSELEEVTSFEVP
jgi:topoisomerase IA-like protein